MLPVAGIVVALLTAPLFAATFTVSNTNDSGLGSFRTALSSANGSPGPDIIVFTVAGTVNVLSPLPAITDQVLIDGTTAPGYVACGFPRFVLNGAAAGSNGLQLLFGASGSTIQAICVQGFPFNGIQLIDSDANTIRACYVGTAQDGNSAVANGQNGLQIEGGSDFNIIGGPGACDGNVISGNNGSGVSLNSSSSNTVTGNHVGVNAAGTAALANRALGILAVNGSNGTIIGAPTVNERNIVSGNGNGLTGNGINIDGSSGTVIRNNYIGLNAAGTVAMGNAENGIAINAAPNTVIGGAGALEGNVIADHNFHAMVLNGASNDCDIYGNRVGTNAAGTVAMGNDDSGVIVINSSNVEIGGTSAGEGNLLSGSLSEYGVFVISSSNVEIEGNLIGTDITGTNPLPNFDGGIRIDFNSSDNFVGGTAAGAANTIAFNTGYGVGVLSADCDRNLISRNIFFCNTGDGIELNGLGNDNHPSPVFSTLTTGGATGTASPGDIIELFYDSTCTAGCQGKDFIGTVNANAVGAWSYTGPINGNATVVALAIATTPVPDVNNTSEFTCQTLLPVTWASFEAELKENQIVRLDWETASETNARHFEVERSTDGQQFFAIGQINADNRTEGSRYTFDDLAPVPGLNFYRLRQVDFNGEFSYSETRAVRLTDSGTFLAIANHPVNEVLAFSLREADAAFSYSLVDQAGKVLASGQVVAAQNGRTEIATAQLAAGLYFLRVRTASRQYTAKILIRH